MRFPLLFKHGQSGGAFFPPVVVRLEGALLKHTQSITEGNPTLTLNPFVTQEAIWTQ